MPNISKLIVAISLLSLLGASCIRLQVTRESSGVFVSTDKGEHWKSASDVLTVGGARATLGSVRISDLVADPQDRQTLYALLGETGIAATHDAAQSWEVVRTLPTKAPVSALVVSPNNVCDLYVGSGTAVLKTEDCLRSWQTMYIDPRADALVLSLALDSQRPGVIYAGLSTGELLGSLDRGETWIAQARFPSGVRTIIVEGGTGQMVLSTTRNGVYTSADQGKSWQQRNENLLQFARSTKVLELIRITATPGGLLALTPLGMFRFQPSTRSWESLRLIPEPGSLEITAIAVAPNNSKELYYAASGVLYSSGDGGARWKSVRLPTNHPISAILIDAADPHRMYIATTR